MTCVLWQNHISFKNANKFYHFTLFCHCNAASLVAGCRLVGRKRMMPLYIYYFYFGFAPSCLYQHRLYSGLNTTYLISICTRKRHWVRWGHLKSEIFTAWYSYAPKHFNFKNLNRVAFSVLRLALDEPQLSVQ